MAEHVVQYEEPSNGNGSGAVLAHAPSDAEIHEITELRQKGAMALAHKREVDRLYKLVGGMTWGSGAQVVHGSSLPDTMRYAIAEFAKLTRANLMYHVDLFSGRPYLNANYWKDRINQEPTFHHFGQRDISPRNEQQAREAFERMRAEALQMESINPELSRKLLDKAYERFFEAEEIAKARANWGAPEWATDVVETTIWKLPETAPIELIRRGELRVEDYLVEVVECNWCGGRPMSKRKRSKEKGGGEYEYDPDPIGNAEPAKTARTRSLRRCGAAAFPATLGEYERQIHKVEKIIEAQWSEIVEARKEVAASLPRPGETQAFAIGGGEPVAARADNAQPMPVRDLTGGREVSQAAPRDVTPAPKSEDPELVDARQRYHEGCLLGGFDADDFARHKLGREPQTADDYRELNSAVNAELDR